MDEKLIAVAVGNDGNIAPHAGRASQWMVYAVNNKCEICPVWTLKLTNMSSLHEWHVRGDGNRHPLHYVDIAIAGSAGEGVKQRLAERNTELLTTVETSPQQAVIAYCNGNLAEGLPHDEQHCLKSE